MTQFKLGQTMRDRASGFTGIAVSRFDFLNGNVQYSLQPKAPEGATTLPEAVSFDIQQLEVVDAGISDTASKPARTPIRVGQKVKDTITGLTGVATMQATYMNGCVSFLVTPRRRLLRENDAEWVSSVRLTAIDEKPAIEPPKSEKPTGGPPMRGVPRAA
ncbi:hypothetical protein [Azospirillum sp. Sh1]|uniref:hypothetical protein n=1 Tax=Azospirillum sp. Sh1 TaxID=2607285 RepID=UPI0011EBF38C|nr:hypothetical protein [Azospirillum sp. Sh1]KAA0573397.1 hypothetical protein FZ029_20685 [Azospirillum sp. Sh1]